MFLYVFFDILIDYFLKFLKIEMIKKNMIVINLWFMYNIYLYIIIKRIIF